MSKARSRITETLAEIFCLVLTYIGVSKIFKNELLIKMEAPIYSSLNELFDAAKLNQKEKNIFLKYKKHCEYWLLRSKVFYSENHREDKDCFIKKLAKSLILLDSDKVMGSKDKFLREMFGDKKVHKIQETKKGVSSRKNSPIIENKYYELEILAYFIRNGFRITLAESLESHQKIPEFRAEKGKLKINVEAKVLNRDNILNNLYGDRMVEGINYIQSKSDVSKGFERINNQFVRNYKSAIDKLKDIPLNEYYIIFINVHYELSLLGDELRRSIININNEMIEYDNLIGLVILMDENTCFVKNVQCNVDYDNVFQNIAIRDYHRFEI